MKSLLTIYVCDILYFQGKFLGAMYFSGDDKTTNSHVVPAFIRVARVSHPPGRKEGTGPFFSDGARLIARYERHEYSQRETAETAGK